MKKTIATVTLALLTLGPAQAVESPTQELGRTLFEATGLGSKGKSCAACHPQGEGLAKVGDFSDAELKDIINACLRDAMGAKMLSTEAQEMDALLAYVRSFQEKR